MQQQRTPLQFVPNFILLVFMSTILSSLGCSNGESSQQVLPPTTPVVVSSVPASGTSAVPFNTSIAVTFNVDIDPATLTPSTFYVSNVSGTVAYNATNVTAVFHPAAPMAANTTYTVVLTTGIKSTAGATFAQQYSFSFSTGNVPDTTPPTITTVVPANGSTNVPLNTQVTVTFSEAMDPTGLVGSTVTGLPASLAYNSQTFTATLAPTSLLAPNTTYSATVYGTARDLAGNQMGAQITCGRSQLPHNSHVSLN